MSDLPAGRRELLDILEREIAATGPISFARFMELALYEPSYGYYSVGPECLGTEGDFVTASDSGTGFGRCLARQLQEIDRRLGPFDPFDLVEYGAGRGLLARDLIDAMSGLDPALHARLRIVLIDRSPGMRRAAAQRVPEAEVLADSLDRPVNGCIVGVELFDALPVHRLHNHGDGVREQVVDLDRQGRLVSGERQAPPSLLDTVRRYGIASESGQLAEVACGAGPMLDAMTASLQRGVCLIVDYGERATELFGPTRPRGTLLAYHDQATNEDYLSRVGRQDLTAHVNFSLLEDRARELGLQCLAFTTQDRFLVANGIVELFEQSDMRKVHDPAQVKQRLQAMQLIHPEAMGRRFKVLALGRGVPRGVEFDGLRDPFARESEEVS